MRKKSTQLLSPVGERRSGEEVAADSAPSPEPLYVIH